MKSVFAILFLTLFSVTTFAQGKITGTVFDENAAPIPFANIVLMAQDSSFIDGTITDIDGKFSIDKIANTKFLTVSCLGYETKVFGIEESLEQVVLKQSDLQLDEITVSARRQLTQIKNGAMVTTVENSLLSKEGNAEDVLKKLPGVGKRGNEIEVFGRGTPEIYINNRKIHDENELMQLNSENIKNVRVIKNPGAKYSAESKAVILITTIDSVGEGISFDIKNGNKFGRYYSSDNLVDINYRKNKFDIFANFSADYSKQQTGADTRQITFVDTIWRLDSRSSAISKDFGLTAKGGFNYQIDENNSVGAFYQYDVADNKYNGNSYMNVLSNGLFYDNSVLTSDAHDKTNPKNSVNLYYNGLIGNVGIDFNVDYMSSKKDVFTDGKENGRTFGFRPITSNSKSSRQLVAEKLVLSVPLWSGNLDFGNEYTNSQSKETYSNLEGYIADSDIKVNENNNAIFAEYSLEIGDATELTAGLRYENIGFGYFIFGEKSASKTYNEFFPSFSFSTSLGDVDLSLSYSGKTSRPAYYQLSSNVTYEDRYSYSSGNPMLKPSKSNDFELMAIYQFFYFQGTFSIVKNPVLNYSTVYGNDHKIKLITFENFDKINTYQLILGSQPSVGIWSSTFNVGIMGQDFTIDYQNQKQKMNSPIALVQFYNSFELPKDFLLSLDFDYMGKGNYENVEMKPTFNVDFSIQKSFFDDAFSVKLAVEDIFEKSQQKLCYYNDDIFIRQNDLAETRFVSLTLKYRFNPAKSKYKGTGAGNDEKQRM